MSWRSINVDLDVVQKIDELKDEFQSRNDLLRDLLKMPELQSLIDRRERDITLEEKSHRRVYGLGKIEVGEIIEISVPGGPGSKDHKLLQYAIENQMYRKHKRFSFEWDDREAAAVAIITRTQ